MKGIKIVKGLIFIRSAKFLKGLYGRKKPYKFEKK